MKIKSRTLILCMIAIIMVSCKSQLQKADYQVVPLPKEIITNDNESFLLTPQTVITYLESQPELKKEAIFLSNYINDIVGYKLDIKAVDAVQGNAINLSYDKSIFENAEAYQIIVNQNNINIKGSDASGVFYALQTIRKSLPTEVKGQDIEFEGVTINDYPRFSYRGMHLDVARHFFPIDSVKVYLDIMALHNVNKFHFHLTDDQGWRIEIKKYPKLTEIGSVRAGTKIRHTEDYDGIPYGGFYTQEQLRDLVQYAADRHITIIPEIDLPGHLVAALAAYPELGCTGGPYEVWQKWGVSEDLFCAGNEQSMKFLEDVLEEVMEVFPSELIHIGGDECPKIRWEECPKCQAKIKELGIKGDDKHPAEAYLQSYVTKRMEQFLEDHGRHIIGWDEILEGELAPNATVMSWRGSEGGKHAAQMHHNVIMTPNTHLYFDYYQSEDTDKEPVAIGGYIPVLKVYSYDPIPEELTKEEAKYILGPQANLWTEYIGEFNVLTYMMLPRIAALSEVQWCLPEQKDYHDFVRRAFRLADIYDLYKWNYSKQIFDIDIKMLPNIAEKSIDVTLSKYGDGDIYYSIDGSDPATKGIKYTGPIKITQNCDFKTVVKRGDKIGRSYYTTFDFSKSSMKPITLKTLPEKSYSFDGAQVLIDGLRGSGNYKTGRWLGFWGKSIDATIDFGNEEEISKVKFNCNIVKGDWIFNAKNVKVLVSNDGNDFKEIHNQEFSILTPKSDDEIYPIEVSFNPVTARYVEVVIEPFDLPEGHSGFGYPAWIFIDEIAIY